MKNRPVKVPDRAKVWCSILYPDSLPDDWISIIDGLHVPVLVSPIHNPDNEESKLHYHLMIKYDSLKSQSQVDSDLFFLNGTHAFMCKSPASYIRYLIHWDNQEKQQFDKDHNGNPVNAILKIRSFGGWDYYKAFDNDSVKNAALQKIADIVIENNFSNYIDLYNYLLNNEYYVEISYMFKNNYSVQMLLNGVYQKKLGLEREKLKIIGKL